MDGRTFRRADELYTKINNLKITIQQIEEAVEIKKEKDKDTSFNEFTKYFIDKFCTVWTGNKGKPYIKMSYQGAQPISVELETEEFVNLLLEHLNKNLKELEEEFKEI